MSEQKTQAGGTHPSFFILILVFFFWGFLAASNGIFIPFCKTHFQLTQLQSQLIDTAYYGAYYVGSLILYLLSVARGFDIINKVGYKMAIIYGLILSIVGALCMIPSVDIGKYGLILASFFVIGLGFSLQQTGAQPFAVALGDPSSGSHRLNMAGGVNSFGTTLGPLIVSLLLFGSIAGSAEPDLKSINMLYIILVAAFVAAILILYFSKLPKVTSDEKLEKTNKATNSILMMTALLILIILIGLFTDVSKIALVSIGNVGVLAILIISYRKSIKDGKGWGAMKYEQLMLGMIALFIYVGVEVTIQSNMGALLRLPDFGGLHESEISQYISLYWGSMMIGRWMGGVAVFNPKGMTKTIVNILVPFLAFGIVMGVNILRGNDVSNLWAYAICIAVFIGIMFYAQEKPAKTLLSVAVFGIVAMLIGVMSTGKIATFAFLCGGLCCSVMWPCIFALSVAGLGKYTPQASSFLIMMILGGALIPPLQGGLADTAIGIHASYWVAVVCFAYLVWFAIKVRSVLKAQGIDFENIDAGGGH